MIRNISHPKQEFDTHITHSKLYTKGALQKECEQTSVQVTRQKSEHKQDKSDKNRITRESARVVQNTSGFFSPKISKTVSFSGAAPTGKKGFWHWVGERPKVKEFIKSPKFEKFLDGAKNLAWTESIAMFFIGISLKPLTIMALPGAKEEDKQYAATKALLGAAVDFSIASTLIPPIEHILKSFNKKINNDGFLKENEQHLKKYFNNKTNFKAFEKVTSYFPKYVAVPLRSALTIALIPPTLKLLFPEVSKRKEEAKTNELVPERDKKQNIAFKGNFAGAKNSNPFSFIDKALERFGDKITEKKATKKILIAIADNPIIKKIVNWSSKPLKKDGKEITGTDHLDALGTAILIGYSAFLQTMHVYNILNNKDIPQERKETLAVNNILAFIIPTIGAFTLDTAVNKSVATFKKYVEKVTGKILSDDHIKSIDIIKKVAIFGMMYKYFSTIITTPLADVTTDWLRDKGIIGKSKNVVTK